MSRFILSVPALYLLTKYVLISRQWVRVQVDISKMKQEGSKIKIFVLKDHIHGYFAVSDNLIILKFIELIFC